MTDRILIRGLRLFGYHGVNPEEKIQGQRFEIDADLYVNLAKACHSDRVEDTVSYAKVIKTCAGCSQSAPMICWSAPQRI